MSDKSNDEKLRILQERLAQIKEKQESSAPQDSSTIEISDSSTPEVENITKDKEPSWGLEEKKPRSFRWLTYIIILGILALVIRNGTLEWDFSKIAGSDNTPKEGIVVDIKEFEVEYKFEIEGNQLAIINSFKDETSAKAMVNELTVKGFKCDYFFLPNKSNSTEEVFKVFIGPYESLEEVNQWKENVNGEIEILSL